MVNFHCKYITQFFHVVVSSVYCSHFYVVFFFLLGMSKVVTPSPYSSKKHDKKCDSCHAYVSDLDPHPICQKCVPRGCSKELPCSHCSSLSLDAWKKWERQQASKRSSSSTKGPKGDSAKGGNKSGKVCPDVPSTPKAESPGRLRLAALESGFSSFRTEIASMFASLQRRFTASQPPDPKASGSRLQDGGAHGGEIFPLRELEDPLASQQPCLGLLGPEVLPLVGRAPGCDLSDPSHMMEPRGPASHTATAMDPVHGIQSSFGSTDVTLTTQRGAVLFNSYGSESMGEVSLGTASMAFTGQRSQPGDAAWQPFTVNDSALPGHSGREALSALPGQSFHSATVHGDTPMEVEMGPTLVGSPAMPDPRSISLPGISRLSGAQPSLSGVRPPPGFTGTSMGSGEFSGSGQTPAIRQAPPLHFGGIRPLPNRTTATITSVTAPAVTMASYGGVSTSTSLGRPISSLHRRDSDTSW